MNELERRYIPVKELRVEKENDELIIEGYPIVYNSRAILWPGIAEEIRPGAATEALKTRETNVYWNHNTGMPMAGFNNGTLEAVEDSKGVRMRADVSKTVWGRDGHEAIAASQVHQMSFGFIVDEEEWIREENPDGSCVNVRIVKKFQSIPDFSPVSQPAYSDTEIDARSKELVCRNMPEAETSAPATSAEDENRQTPVSILRKKNNLMKEGFSYE